MTSKHDLVKSPAIDPHACEHVGQRWPQWGPGESIGLPNRGPRRTAPGLHPILCSTRVLSECVVLEIGPLRALVKGGPFCAGEATRRTCSCSYSFVAVLCFNLVAHAAHRLNEWTR